MLKAGWKEARDFYDFCEVESAGQINIREGLSSSCEKAEIKVLCFGPSLIELASWEVKFNDVWLCFLLCP